MDSPPSVPAAATRGSASLRDRYGCLTIPRCAAARGHADRADRRVPGVGVRSAVRRRRADARRRTTGAWPGSASRASFLSDLTLDPPASTGDVAGPPHLDEDWLVLSTIHSAKGCEWDEVHVLHASDGCIPSDMATGDAEQIEEERRLLYVAMTRARDDLWLHVPRCAITTTARTAARRRPHVRGRVAVPRRRRPSVAHLDERAPADRRTRGRRRRRSTGTASVDGYLADLFG